MKLNKIFLVFLLCFISINNIAQNSKNDKLNTLAKKLFVDMNNKDFDAIVDMTYPKVFEIATKEQMKEVFKMFFEGNSEYVIKIPKIEPIYKLSKVYSVEKNNLEYAFVSYDLKFNMTFNNQEFDDEQKKMMVGAMGTKGMEVNFISNNSMNINMLDRITILLKDDLSDGKWTMLNYDPDSPLFYQMTPTSLIEEGKKYKQELMLLRKKENQK